MKQHYPTISVAIPAHNEEKNIAQVLRNILQQYEKGWKLKEILVFCDGCTDATEEKAKSVKNKKITVINDGKRKGKTMRINEMFSLFSGNILVMFDADITLKNKHVITKLIQPLVAQDNVMLVGGNSMPYPPKTFFEKAVYTTFQVFYESRKNFRNGNNVFGCTGSILGIKKDFAKKVTLPKVINEDAYIYMTCLKKGYSFIYVDKAIVYYKLPTNIPDYVRQVFRSEPKAIHLDLKKYFAKTLHDELDRPLTMYAKSIAKVFIRNPLGVSLMVGINLLCKPFFPVVNRNYSLQWFTAHSTK